MLRGALAAAVTPLDGDRLDEPAFGPYVDFLAASGVDGLLALGTTGEGLLFGVEERKRAVELFLSAAGGRLQVAAHCGAQTTADTVVLASHAAEAGVDAVAVIGPPYFQLDERALLDHFAAAAAACAPLPFYVYEFERASGYAVPVAGAARAARARAEPRRPQGLGRALRSFAPYCRGPRRLRRAGGAHLRRDPAGAVGAVSGLAAAFPDKVAAVVREPSEAGAIELGELRAAVERFPRHAALKFILGLRGVPIREDVRRPLRQLSDGEREELRGWLESS